MALILFLHGPSSSGKSTLASELRRQSERPFLHLSIDHLRDSGAWDPARYPDWPTARPAFFDGFHRAIAGFAAAGNDLIIEHILDTPGWHRDLQDLLNSHNLLFIGFDIALETLNAREQQRGDRPIGSAAADTRHIHDRLHYDLHLDGSRPVTETAAEILQTLCNPLPRSRFFA
ncbi:chloramphenicol phosphotransferase CPT family protein [Phaeobacter porticola]|uniref:Putative chloramphenicol phosphotransferase-like protein n=1 Tax=Phaeobacter porticola TaxID=1844006 RepID=A0A1L3I9E8_9RHOB|nr:AAA family ATPase [Phaeobacter porticola]APG48653.1 putative chloramphenicol phosphotransferase-like protein [Phaeobacter porticola]